MKKIFIALLISAISFSTVACSGGSSNEKSAEETTKQEITTVKPTKAKTTVHLNVSEQEAKEYFSKIINSVTSVNILDSGRIAITCSLDKEHRDQKSNYYPFAKEVIDTARQFSKDYDVSDVFIMVYFYLDKYATTSWITNDFGKTGDFTDEMPTANYKERKSNFSLEDLKEKYSNFAKGD